MYKAILIFLILSGMGFYSQQTGTQSSSQNPQFETIDGYVNLLLEPATSTKYDTKEPEGFERIKIDGTEKKINVMFDGVYGSVFVLAKKNWNEVSAEDIQTFYLEVVSSAPCLSKGEFICSIPMTVEWYGPFEGKLGKLVK